MRGLDDAGRRAVSFTRRGLRAAAPGGHRHGPGVRAGRGRPGPARSTSRPASSTARRARACRPRARRGCGSTPIPSRSSRTIEWGDQQTPFDEKFIELGHDRHRRRRPRDAQPRHHRGRRHRPAAGGRGHRLGVRARRPSGARGPDPEGAAKPVYLRRQDRARATPRRGDPPVSLDDDRRQRRRRRASPSTATYTLIAENWDYDWFQQDGRWQWRRTSRDAVVGQGDGQHRRPDARALQPPPGLGRLPPGGRGPERRQDA